jgi:hypothetical protein
MKASLPQAFLSKASLRGREYAWPLDAVEDVITAAAQNAFACIGGQAQFRIPDGTCEMYWLSIERGKRLPEEAWENYVKRSSTETLSQFRALRQKTDFMKEALSWPDVAKLLARGDDLNQYLCFVLYFDTQPS